VLTNAGALLHNALGRNYGNSAAVA
jgi:hypothetical protein